MTRDYGQLLLVMALAVATACNAPAPSAEPLAAPADWSLTLEYRPSGMPAPGSFVPWITTIDSHGRCTQSVRRWSDKQDAWVWTEQPERTLPVAAVDALRAALEAARFDELPRYLGDRSVTDQYSFVLVRNVGGDEHRVESYGPAVLAWAETQDVSARAAQPGQRFLSVVVEVLRCMPSPISSQTPEFFERITRRA
ncbi:MAG TPA: hypothetical protein VFY71_13905 [Planctomycetota bacterium]|nr:hypothetical protein [Planctomycetota bacterium]